MDNDVVDESDLFRAVARSGARALLIGRQAMVIYGLPVNTADYDYWVHIDDIEAFNATLTALGLDATCDVGAARLRGRYALEGHDKVDVVTARALALEEGALSFDDAWTRRVELDYEPGVRIAVPCVDDLIRTKKVALRPKDVEDILALEGLKRREVPT